MSLRGLTPAARRALLVRDGLAAVAEWEAEHGPLTEAELDAAHRRVAAQVGREPGPGAEALGMSVVYDAAALIAAERSDRAVWADHRPRLRGGPRTRGDCSGGRAGEPVRPTSSAAAFSQRGCDIVPFGDDEAHDIGALAGRSGSSDVVDVHVVATAHRRRFGVLTSDENDLKPIADALRPRVPVFHVLRAALSHAFRRL